MPTGPFDIHARSDRPVSRAAAAAARPLASWLLALPSLQRLYDATRSQGGAPFDELVLRALGVTANVAVDDTACVPAEGPLIVAVNHPHGAVDGLLVSTAIRRRRGDVRIVANHLLARIPELHELCFFIDPFDGPRSAMRSVAGLRAARRWLHNDGLLIIFPAGEVAHRRGCDGKPMDSPWKPTLGRLALATGARVVPARIDGANRTMFYAAGRVHASLRTALLPRELLAQQGQSIAVRFGPAISADEIAAMGTASAATALVRRRVEDLGVPPGPTLDEARVGREHVEGPDTTCLGITGEIAELPPEACLVASGAFRVFITAARQIPQTLAEIGRLRELTYRRVGEGTGRPLDLDQFDEHYLHLFAWDDDHQRVVGAYRIARTDRILSAQGIGGLYTRTLFRYDERLIERLSPALELGRSFVRPEYQRHHSALLVLWKGIGQFVARHPDYRVLFGPVSISARYSDHSHDLLTAFLRQNHLDRELAELVAAIHPRPEGALRSVPRTIGQAERLVSAAEPDGKGVPVLLRQYLKLNARVLGFNVDPDFGEALDALMMIDLATVDQTILGRYLGRDESARFLSRHRPAHAA